MSTEPVGPLRKRDVLRESTFEFAAIIRLLVSERERRRETQRRRRERATSRIVIVVDQAESGTWGATIEELGVLATGDTREEAVRLAKEAAYDSAEFMAAHGLPIQKKARQLVDA